jgi:F-type H+-transporting ATPase subunit epsilon
VESTSGKSLQCIVVTPEKAVLDEPAQFVALPMFDGELGVLPGRAPLIGRLGLGELRIQREGSTQRFFVDGGFAQVRADTVTVLTAKATPAEQIDSAAAERQLQTALTALPKSAEEQAAQLRSQARARAQLRIAHKGAAAADH